MKEYELTVLIHPDLEMDIEKPLTKLRGIIKDNGGEIIKESSWGKKRLAYQIQRQDFAVYVNFELNLPPASLIKISGILNITDELLRYLLVTVDEKTKAKLADVARQRDRAHSNDNESER